LLSKKGNEEEGRGEKEGREGERKENCKQHTQIQFKLRLE
jgi:hypothetical protein